MSTPDRLSATTAALRQTTGTATPRLLAFTTEQRLKRPAPGKWSKQEIMGHLVDSAVNNIARFVRLQQPGNDITGMVYQQEHWVQVQAYQEADWEQLVQLWNLVNLHIAHLLDQVPATALEKVMHFNGAREDATLHYLATDYLDHLRHHLHQVFDNDTI